MGVPTPAPTSAPTTVAIVYTVPFIDPLESTTTAVELQEATFTAVITEVDGAARSNVVVIIDDAIVFDVAIALPATEASVEQSLKEGYCTAYVDLKCVVESVSGAAGRRALAEETFYRVARSYTNASLVEAADEDAAAAGLGNGTEVKSSGVVDLESQATLVDQTSNTTNNTAVEEKVAELLRKYPGDDVDVDDIDVNSSIAFPPYTPPLPPPEPPAPPSPPSPPPPSPSLPPSPPSATTEDDDDGGGGSGHSRTTAAIAGGAAGGGVLLIWLLAAGVVLWRRPRSEATPASEPARSKDSKLRV